MGDSVPHFMFDFQIFLEPKAGAGLKALVQLLTAINISGYSSPANGNSITK